MPPPLSPLLRDMRSNVDSLARRVTLLKYLGPAILRDENLREAAASWWTKQKTVGRWVREDEGVWRAARRDSGTKDGDEKLKEKVRDTVNEMLRVKGPTVVVPAHQ